MMYEVFHHFTRSALSFEYDGSVPLLAGKVCAAALIPLIRSSQDQDHKTIRPSSIKPNHGTGSTGQAPVWWEKQKLTVIVFFNDRLSTEWSLPLALALVGF